jgi:pimeloyl-ACP methyl ester carboxylesterase
LTVAITNRVADVPLAYEMEAGAGPVVVFCAGFNSEMNGTKALNLRDYCKARGQAFLRFDYAGHGTSGGRFIDGCIGDWAADAAFIIDTAAKGRDLVLVGSSMGGWISLLLARALGARLKGLLLIAPAPDFTERLMKPSLTESQREFLATDGVFYIQSEYGAPTPFTAKLLDDGARHLVLNGVLPVTCPVRILHGVEDGDVPYELSLTLMEHLASDDVRLTLLKGGDHRLSSPAQLGLLRETLAGLLGEDGA